TELRGVASDIVVPSPSDVVGVGESQLTDPLPWDTVPALRFDREGRVAPYLPALRTKSAKRIASDRSFVLEGQQIAELKKRLAAGTVSLNEADRRAEMAASKAREDEAAEAARSLSNARPTYAITVKNAATPGLPAPMPAATKPSPDAGAPEPGRRDDA